LKHGCIRMVWEGGLAGGATRRRARGGHSEAGREYTSMHGWAGSAGRDYSVSRPTASL